MSKSKTFLRAVVLLLVTTAGPTRADVSYSYVTDQPFYIIVPGASQTVKFYLLETLTAGSTPLIDADGGMFSVGLKVTRTSGTALFGPLTLDTSDFGGSPTQSGGPTGFQFVESIGAGQPGVKTVNTGGDPANARTNAVYLGSVQLFGGPTIGDTFTLRPFDADGGSTLTNTGRYDLDFSNVSPSYSGASLHPTAFTLTDSPEPATPAAYTVLALAVALHRRRRG